MSDRDEVIDAVKGVATLLVVFSHCIVPFGLKCWYLLFSCMIPVFFIVSGRLQKQDFGLRGLFRRECRILCPYFFYGIVIISVHNILGGHCELAADGLALLYSRYCLHPLGIGVPNTFFLNRYGLSPMWFLTCMALSYLLYYPLMHARRREKEVLLVTAYVSITVLFARIPILLPWSLDTAFLGAIFIWIGKNFPVKEQHVSTLVITIFIYIILEVNTLGGVNLSIREYGVAREYGIPFYLICGTLFFHMIEIGCTLLKGTIIIKAFAVLGEASLILMCCQYAIFSDFITVGMNRYVSICVSVFLCLFLSLFLKRLRGRHPDWLLVKYLM